MIVTEKALKETMDSILTKAHNELKTMKQEDLEKFWYFKYDSARSPAQNLYEFHSMLDLYAGKCRKWEEMHNGYVCVVERVHDTYLMPKIREFKKSLENG